MKDMLIINSFYTIKSTKPDAIKSKNEEVIEFEHNKTWMPQNDKNDKVIKTALNTNFDDKLDVSNSNIDQNKSSNQRFSQSRKRLFMKKYFKRFIFVDSQIDVFKIFNRVKIISLTDFLIQVQFIKSKNLVKQLNHN